MVSTLPPPTLQMNYKFNCTNIQEPTPDQVYRLKGADSTWLQSAYHSMHPELQHLLVKFCKDPNDVVINLPTFLNSDIISAHFNYLLGRTVDKLSIVTLLEQMIEIEKKQNSTFAKDLEEAEAMDSAKCKGL